MVARMNASRTAFRQVQKPEGFWGIGGFAWGVDEIRMLFSVIFPPPVGRAKVPGHAFPEAMHLAEVLTPTKRVVLFSRFSLGM